MVPPAKRKAEDEYLGRLKSCKLANIQPNELNNHTTYSGLQKDKREKILDNRPDPDEDVPPLPLLYRGFGHFLDSTSLASIQSGKFSSDHGQALEREVCERVVQDSK